LFPPEPDSISNAFEGTDSVNRWISFVGTDAALLVGSDAVRREKFSVILLANWRYLFV
jgi:hypothetical protein